MRVFKNHQCKQKQLDRNDSPAGSSHRPLSVPQVPTTHHGQTREETSLPIRLEDQCVLLSLPSEVCATPSGYVRRHDCNSRTKAWHGSPKRCEGVHEDDPTRRCRDETRVHATMRGRMRVHVNFFIHSCTARVFTRVVGAVVGVIRRLRGNPRSPPDGSSRDRASSTHGHLATRRDDAKERISR